MGRGNHLFNPVLLRMVYRESQFLSLASVLITHRLERLYAGQQPTAG